jgi:hypothetical protein
VSKSIDIVLVQFPIVFIKIDGDQTPEDFEEYIGAFNKLYEKQQPFSIVTYLKKYSANTGTIARIGKWFKETEPLIKKYWVSNAMVSPSAGFRFLLGAVYLVKPLPTANRVCATAEEAVAFTKATWKGRNLPTNITVSWPFEPLAR